jgi:UDP-glucose 4-epimerase
VPICGLRFFNVYGPRQDPLSSYSGVISIFCDRLKAGRQITVHGNGRQKRDFIYVGDVVRALLAAMDNCSLAGEIFNVCRGAATTIADLGTLLGHILGTKPDLTFGPPRTGDIRSSIGDPSKAQRVLGFTASIDLVTGLRRTLEDDFVTVPGRAVAG